MTTYLASAAWDLSLLISSFPISALAIGEDVILNNESGIPDKNLYSAVLEKFSKGTSDHFTKEEAASITSLEVDGILLLKGASKRNL